MNRLFLRMNHKLIAQWPKTIAWINSKLKAGKNRIKTSLISKNGVKYDP